MAKDKVKIVTPDAVDDKARRSPGLLDSRVNRVAYDNRILTSRVKTIRGRVDTIEKTMKCGANQVDGDALLSRLNRMEAALRTEQAAHNGDVFLEFAAPRVIQIPIATLNAGPFTLAASPALKSILNQEVHKWTTPYNRVLLNLTETYTGGQNALTIPSAVMFKQDLARAAFDVAFDGSGTWPASVKATGQLTAVAGSALVSKSDSFTLEDNDIVMLKADKVNYGGHVRTFQFTDDGTVTDPLFVPVLFDAGDTDAQVAASMIAAINSQTTLPAIDGKELGIVATSGGGAVVDLEQTVPGDDGNTAIVEAVADAGFLKTDFSGGSADKIEIEAGVNSDPADETWGTHDQKIPFGVAVYDSKLRIIGV